MNRNGAKIGMENDKYVDKDRTLIVAIRWRRSDDISTITDGEVEVEASFSHQRNAALLRSRSRGNVVRLVELCFSCVHQEKECKRFIGYLLAQVS